MTIGKRCFKALLGLEMPRTLLPQPLSFSRCGAGGGAPDNERGVSLPGINDRRLNWPGGNSKGHIGKNLVGIVGRVLIVATCVILVSCQAIELEEGKDVFQEEPLRVAPEISETLPPSLWSPAKRTFNAHYYFLVAEFEMMQRRSQVAQKLYEAAYGLEPDPLLGKKVVASLAINDQEDKALIQAKKMVLIYPKDAEIHNLYAQLLVRQNLYGQAKVEFERAMDLENGMVQAYLGLIGVQRVQGDLKAAIKVAELMIQRLPHLSEGWSLLAKLQISSGEYQKALSSAQKSYRMQPQNVERQLLYSIALELVGQGEEAMEIYDSVFNLVQSQEDFVSQVVTLYRQLGDSHQLLSRLENPKIQNESSAGLLMHRAFIYWDQGEQEKALNLLSKLQSQHPSEPRYLYLVAIGQERSNRNDQAIMTYRKIGQHSQNFVHSRLRVIALLRRLKRTDDAMLEIQQMVKVLPEESINFYLLGAQLLADDHKYEQIVRFLKAGLDQHPKNAKLHYLVGIYNERLGNMKAAIESMKAVIDLEPTHHSALNFLGYIYAELGENLEDAEQLVIRALVERPHEGSYKDSLGWIYFKMEEFSKAEELLLEAHQLSPQEGVILEHLGDVAWEQDKSKNAVDYYQQALKLNLDERDRVRIINKLKVRHATTS